MDQLISDSDLRRLAEHVAAQVAQRISEILSERVAKMQRASGEAQAAMEEAKNVNAKLDEVIGKKKADLALLEKSLRDKQTAFNVLYGGSNA